MNAWLPKPSEYLDPSDHEDAGLLQALMRDPFYLPQLNAILEAGDGDIQPDFLGFTSTYRHLALMIPLHWTVVDFGCSYAAQSYYFRKHKKYIGVDGWATTRIAASNTEHRSMTIEAYLKHYREFEGKGPVFAICNYVPTSTAALRAAYTSLFVFYPEQAP
jgi:hypothetical protein